jgi:hypothetical protein
MSIHGVTAHRAPVVLGGAALLVGAIVYNARPLGFHAAVLDSLPAFLHVFAMTLLMASLGSRGATPRLEAAWLAVAWVAVNAFFEMGQHPDFAPSIAASLDAGCGDWPICARTSNYFLYGTFDWFDLLAAALGGFAALRVLRVVVQRGAVT